MVNSPPPPPQDLQSDSPQIQQNSCKSCNDDDNSHMVQCDECDEWHHFRCVNVTASIEDEDWRCPKCQQKDMDIPGATSLYNKEFKTTTRKPISTSTVLQTQADGSEENPSNNEQHPPPSPTPLSHPLRKKLETNSKFATKNQRDPKTAFEQTKKHSQIKLCAPARAKSKSTSTVKSLKLNLMKLEEERELMKKRDREYLEAKYKLLEQQTDSESDSEAESTTSRLDEWVNQQAINKKQVCPTLNHQSGSKQQIQASKTQEQKAVVNLNETWIGANGSSMPAVNLNNTTNRDFTTLQNPSIIQIVTNDNNYNNSDNVFTNSQTIRTPILNTQQIATRHIVSKELPTFTGRPEEWPLFFSCFESTTRACGFSDDENLIRLNRSLKGAALDAVRAKLLYPSQVPSIMATLKMLFGRPELIIKTLICRLRQERPPRDDKLETLVTFSLSVQNIVATMEAAGLTSHLNNPCLMQELTDKLPFQTRLNWGVFKMGKQTTNLATFSSWLFQVAQAACEVTDVSLPSKDVKSDKRRLQNNQYLSGHHEEAKDQQKLCVICKGSCKSVENCGEFVGLNLNNRWKAVKEHFLCRTCLVNHRQRRCLLTNRCGIMGCTYRHHKLLHKHEQPVERSENQNLSSYHCAHEHKGNLLFKILPVSLYNNDIKIETFAFLDDGSSVTLMDNELADIINLKGESQELRLKWTSGASRTEEKSKKVNLMIAATHSPKKYALTNVRTVESLSLPTQTVNFESLSSRFHYLKGIPIRSFSDARPRILIGLDNANLLNSLKHREGKINQPAAIKTRLGWTIFGPCNEIDETPIEHPSYHLCECKEKADEKLHELVREFFSIESFGSKELRKLTKGRDVRAEIQLENSAKRIGKSFSVPLLWKTECIEFPDSKPSAEKRLLLLEKRLHKEPELAENLESQISDYLCKGYARKLTEADLQNFQRNRIWYLPIFPVLNPNKPSKVRLVWDAAAQVEGVSLNSMLLSGPDYLVSLIDILFRFRQRNIAICGDIREMFHQVHVDDADQHAQRFLWRNKETGIIEDYVMKVLIFGSTCSPYCAEYIKNKNAMEHSDMFPRASEAIIRNHYVDDYLDSFDTPEEAIRVTNEVIHIHQQAGFEIRNFMSNSESVLTALGTKAANSSKSFKNRTSPYEFEKVLGMWWSPTTDQFSFLFNSKNFDRDILDGIFPPTKRIVLRVLMSTFDPLGLIGHFLMLLKILLQSIWRERISWDEQIHEEQVELWKEWLKLLPTIKQIKIRRPYLDTLKFDAESSIELHVFVDASLSGFAAVCYLRVQAGSSIECNLVCSKTKVASLKQISVPRMELEAAVLGVRLAQAVINGHSIQIDRRYFWSDSQSVLCWIKNDNRKLKQFVTFRVGEILEISNEDEWRWVPSEHNVADDATKWNLKVDFSSQSRWYKGPAFLYNPKDSWPSNPKQDIQNEFNVDRDILDGIFPPTKRIVLRVLMSTFDPLGLIGHFLMLLKILLQSIWRERISWDEQIHEEQVELWKEWLKLLPTIKQIKIRRPYLDTLKFDAESSIELHVFVDASLSGFAAVCYLRVQAGSSIECNLVCSKTKVASLKQISVPRMELEAAVLGVRLAQAVINGHSIQIDRRYFWSDSQSVLCWIKNDNRKLKQFVTFRVGEILEISNEDEWRWVPSEHNVADDATKWNLKVDFSSQSRWYKGPAFLYNPKDSWPSNPKQDIQNEFKVFIHADVTEKPLVNYLNFSEWKKIVTAISYVHQYSCTLLKKIRKPEELLIPGKSKGTKNHLFWLCQDEKGRFDYVKGAEIYLYKLCQSEGYPDEIKALQNNQPIAKTSQLRQSSPYLDAYGVMRVKGRIDASKHVHIHCKRPIILPTKHQITNLIVESFHEKYKHLFFETAINEIRQFFYIPTLRVVLKKVQKGCQECRNNRAKPAAPLMSELPEARLQAFTRPFSYVGLDYFGPMLVTVGRRTEKRWGVLFTCLTVRAIQIEIAHSLTSDSCILAIKRFCAKRGRPKEIWSDNGTNFRGASQELKTAIDNLRTADISKYLKVDKIEWKFIPPSSPHMGGSWERLIRSVKQTLTQMHIGRNPKDEVLLTMMAEVEFIINSRPLTYIPLDTDSDEALTPNHFLMGSSNGIRLTGELLNDNHSLRKHWLTSEQYSNLFWKRWVKEYLPSLTRRTKWFLPAKPVSEGDIVLIVDENNPRNTWPKGIILQANQSKDGQTRSAIVKTSTGIYTRPVAKLAVLDVRRFGENGNLEEDITSLPGGNVAKPGNAD